MKTIITSPVPYFNLMDFNLKPDDGFLLSGSTGSTTLDNNRGAVISLKPDGKTVWTSDFIIDTFQCTIAGFAVQQKDGLTMVSGVCFDSWYEENRFVATLDQNGKVQDHKIFSVPPMYHALSGRIIPRSDGYFYLVSSYYPYDWNSPYLLEIDLLDTDYNLIYSKLVEGVHAEADQITLSSSDGLIIAGTLEEGIFDKSPDFLFMQTDKDGNEIIHKAFGSPVNWEYGNYCIEEDGNGFIFSGTTAQSSACTIYRITGTGDIAGPDFIGKFDIYSSKNYILKTQGKGYMMMSYTNAYFKFIRLNEDLTVKWTASQIIRKSDRGNGSWSSCHFVPAGNGRFAFAYLNDDKISFFRTRSY